MQLKSTLLAITLALSLTGMAHADSGTTNNSVGAPPTNTGHRGMMDPVAMAHAHLKRIKTALNLTADQQPAWQAFADKAMAQAQQMADERKAMHEQSAQTQVSAPDRMAHMAELMQQHAQSLSATADAAKMLYAKLTPEQRNTFDSMVQKEHRHMMDRAKQHWMQSHSAGSAGTPAPAAQ